MLLWHEILMASVKLMRTCASNLCVLKRSNQQVYQSSQYVHFSFICFGSANVAFGWQQKDCVARVRFPFVLALLYREFCLNTFWPLGQGSIEIKLSGTWYYQSEFILLSIPLMGHLQLISHVVRKRHAGTQATHWDKTNKENYHFKWRNWSCLFVLSQ